MTSDRIGYGQVEFKSVGPPVGRTFHVRMSIMVALPLAAFAFLLNQSFWRDPWLVGFVIAFPLMMTFVVPRMSKGKIILDHEGITLQAGGRTLRYSWGDIERIFVTSVRARGGAAARIFRFAGVDIDREFIELKLRKSLRFNPITENQSTRGWGIPTLLMRATHLYPDDPYALLMAAEIHLQPGLHA